MEDEQMAPMREGDALAHVHEANMRVRQLVHHFLTERMTLTPDETSETQRELAALSLGTAWLHARLRDMIASTQNDQGSPTPPDRGAHAHILPDSSGSL